MTRFLVFVVAFGLAATLFSERFYSEDEVAEEMISEFNVNIGEITEELKTLNDKQMMIIELLNRISLIADQHRVASWSNQQVATSNE